MRALRILLVVAVVLGGILVGLDRLAVTWAESEVAGRTSLAGGRPDSVEVDIKGFPFLTQAADKHFGEVEVVAKGVRTQAGGKSVRIGELTVDLRDVTVTGDWDGVRAGRATGTAVISYADLVAASDRGATAMEYGGPGKVKVTGSVTVLGRTVTRTVVSSVTLVDGGTVKVRADEVPGEGLPLVEDMIRERTDFERPLGRVAGMGVSKVEPRPEGLVVTVTGQDVAVAG
ncbi:LmeA family phospholipid-binding protein [Streptomyces filamentosus]|uniref:LmeA family phospholipid-binding protein n=1 Tax=Streptomyces filamentosus TaxID=67294 RepID=UPI0033C5486B